MEGGTWGGYREGSGRQLNGRGQASTITDTVKKGSYILTCISTGEGGREGMCGQDTSTGYMWRKGLGVLGMG